MKLLLDENLVGIVGWNTLHVALYTIRTTPHLMSRR